MNTVKKCKGKTKSGNYCKKKCLEGSDCCEIHKNQSVNTTGKSYNTETGPSYNEDCPICFSSVGEMHLTPCMHQLHIECAKGMSKVECPLCMAEVSNFPLEVVKQIKSNGEEYQSKLDREDFENFVAYQNERENTVSTIHVSPPLRVEIASAMQFLKESGIPLEYIPTSVKLSIIQDNPTIPQGTLFYAIVGHAIEKVAKDIKDFSDSNIGSSSSDDDDEENPFPDNNATIRVIDINFV